MGRQVLWGGKGRPPSREVLNAAAKAARSEMMQRIRENKDKQGQPARRKPEGGSGNGQSAGNGGNGQQARNGRNANGNGNGQQARNGNGNNGNGNRPARGPKPQQPANGHGARPPQQPREVRVERDFDDDRDDRMPRNVDPLRTNMPGRRDMTGVKKVNTNGQPDPTRTSIDSMGATGRRNNNRGGRGGNPARNYGR